MTPIDRIDSDRTSNPVNPIIRATSDQSDQSDGSSADIRELFFFHPDDPFFDRMADRIDRIHPDRTSS